MTVAAQRVLDAAVSNADDPTFGFLSESDGFLPAEPPLTTLPESHSAWDQIAAEIPELFARARLRARAHDLPVLDIDTLPDEYLRRASLILGVLAHVFVREGQMTRAPLTGTDPIARTDMDLDPALELPKSIERPWYRVCERLGRLGPSLHFDDLAVYNWRLRDANCRDRMRVENLNLLVPTTASPEERIFYTTIVENMAVVAPLTPLLMRSQQAVVDEDEPSLIAVLSGIYDGLRKITQVSLQKIDPNPLSRNHVDPLIWAKFVAPLAAPIRKGELGLSGGASPTFVMLDTFFERTRLDSPMGREGREIRRWLPRGQKQFIEALREVSIAEFVKRSGSRPLAGAYAQTLEAYAGSHGWLGKHRLKVYGFMETGFRAGRNSTNGGFSGSLRDRAWEQLDHDMERSRRERFSAPPRWHRVPRSELRAVDRGDDGGSFMVTFDLRDSGLRYQPGDRCAVMATVHDELVDDCLHALGAHGDEPVALTRLWVEHLSGLNEGDSPSTLSLREFLRLAQLRPLLRDVVKRLCRTVTMSGVSEEPRPGNRRRSRESFLRCVLGFTRSLPLPRARLARRCNCRCRGCAIDPISTKKAASTAGWPRPSFADRSRTASRGSRSRSSHLCASLFRAMRASRW